MGAMLITSREHFQLHWGHKARKSSELGSITLCSKVPIYWISQRFKLSGLMVSEWIHGRKMSNLGNDDADSVLFCGLEVELDRAIEGLMEKLSAQGQQDRIWVLQTWSCRGSVGDDFHKSRGNQNWYFGVLTKIFNVARFVGQFKPPDTKPDTLSTLTLDTKSMIGWENTEKYWMEIDIYSAAQAVKTFLTGVFPSHWMEMAKSRLYEDDPSAAWTLHIVRPGSLAIFSPVCRCSVTYPTCFTAGCDVSKCISSITGVLCWFEWFNYKINDEI